MKVAGEISVQAPQDAVFEAIQDARFFASCVDGVQDLKELGDDNYEAVLETKVAYIKFRFNIAICVTRKISPSDIEAKMEGTPIGIVGRVTATSKTHLSQDGDHTKIAYEIDAALTGRLGSLGQPVLRAKAKEMEKQFTARLSARFAEPSGGNA